ncbi:MAG TPA: hypothetical protein VGL20_04080 [Candidatus Dormibacteraeota bacterium]
MAAALLGAWLGHTLEYLRVVDGAPPVRSALAGAHAYMVPVGALLALAAAAAGAGCWRAWLALGRRLDSARAGLAHAWRGGGTIPAGCAAGTAAVVSPPARLVALWLPLGAAQLGVYLAQENIESVLAGGRAAGLGPVLGVHWAAAALQLGVALVLAAALLLAGRALAGRAGALERCERLLRTLWARRRDDGVPRGARPCLDAPVERFGRRLWSRPPPALP